MSKRNGEDEGNGVDRHLWGAMADNDTPVYRMEDTIGIRRAVWALRWSMNLDLGEGHDQKGRVLGPKTDEKRHDDRLESEGGCGGWGGGGVGGGGCCGVVAGGVILVCLGVFSFFALTSMVSDSMYRLAMVRTLLNELHKCEVGGLKVGGQTWW